MKYQLRGVCSFCGRSIAVKGNTIVDHGYSKHNGWKMYNSCPGSFKAHFGTEKGLEAAKTFIANLTKQMENAEKRQEERACKWHIEYLNKMIENWKEADAVKVPVIKDPPKIHFAAVIYRTNAAACCASAMGAQSFAGQTTKNENEVTCPRCL